MVRNWPVFNMHYITRLFIETCQTPDQTRKNSMQGTDISLRKAKSSTRKCNFWGICNRSQESSHQYSEKVIQFAIANGTYPSEPRKKKKNSYFPLYWLFNKDPYNGLS